MTNRPTVIVTGASQGIGAAIVQAFLRRNYNVVATSRNMSGAGLAQSPHLALVDGDIGKEETAEKITHTAKSTFGSVNHVVNDAGIFLAKPFTDYTSQDLHRFVSTHLEGFVFLTQLAVTQMLLQGSGGSVTTITSALADNPMAGTLASIPMMTKGGLNAITLSLASEYAKNHIRFNAVGFRSAGHRCGCSVSCGSQSHYRRGAARGRRCPRWPVVSGSVCSWGLQLGGTDRPMCDRGHILRGVDNWPPSG